MDPDRSGPIPPIWAPEISARFARSLLGWVRDHGSADVADAVVAEAGVPRAELEDETAWLSLRFCEWLCQAVVDRMGPDVLEKAGRDGMSPRVLGFLYAFMRAFASPSAVYRKAVDITPQFNKTGRFEVRELSRGRCLMAYIPLEGKPRETTRHLCTMRREQLGAIPTVFGMPQARVLEHSCIATGAPECLLEFRWLDVARSVGLWLGLIAGIVLGAILFSPILSWPTLAVALVGGALGTFFDARREIARRGSYLAEQNAALAASSAATERRFQEVVEAKREVDAKVETRTAELAEALERLRKVSRAKDDFFANVSHELRTPLTLVLAPLEKMLRSPGEVEHASVEAMHRSAVRLTRLINDLLELAKIDAGAMRIRPVASDLGALVHTLGLSFVPLAEARGVRLDLDVQAVTAPVDPERMEIAIANLIANALKFTPRGGNVRVRVRQEAGLASVKVSDSGPGIAPEDRERIFERFGQASKGPRVAGGTGIGLALVQEIATLHGGQVGLESVVGQGSTFTIQVPQDESLIPAENIERRQIEGTGLAHSADQDPWKPLLGAAGAMSELALEPRRTDQPEEPRVPASDRPTLLLVEDHPDLRAFLAKCLEPRCRVVTANDGVDALEKLAQDRPAIVVSDIMMPRMDGLELCRRLKGGPATRAIPVILLTARTGVEKLVEGFSAGADDYLPKPFHEKELLARVDVHLRLAALMQEVAKHERLAMLGVVAAGVAHEVRNPLAAIQGILPRLKRSVEDADTDPGRTIMALDLVGDAAGRIERVTRDLLDLSRVDREAVASWDVRSALASAVRLLAAGKPNGSRITLQPGPEAQVMGRPAELNQVLLNILDNAIRAISPTGRVEVSIEVAGDHIEIDVVDDGPGIPADVLPQIFEPFFTTRAGGQGTGLGLAIARRIVEDHHGAIEVTCPPTGGTCVRIKLATRQPARSVQSEVRAGHPA